MFLGFLLNRVEEKILVDGLILQGSGELLRALQPQLAALSLAAHRTGPLDSWVLGDKWQDANLNWGYWKINEQRTLMSTHISFIWRIKNFLNLRKQLWDLVWIKTRYCNQFFSSLQFIQCTSLHSCSFRKHYNFNLFQQIIYAFQYFSILFLSMCFTILHTILVHELLK